MAEGVEDLAGLVDLVASLDNADVPGQSTLARVRELLPAAHPALVAEISPRLMKLLENPDAEVRKSVLAMAEDLAQRCPDVLSIMVQPLLTCLSDSSSQVVRRSTLTATAIFRPAIAIIAAQSDESLQNPDCVTGAPMWRALCDIQDTLLAKLTLSAANRVPSQVLRDRDCNTLPLRLQLLALARDRN